MSSLRHCPLDGTKQLIRRYRLGQEIIRSGLDGLHGGRDVCIACEKHNGERRAEFAQTALQLRTAQTRYPDIEKDAAGTALIRQTVQQMLGRRICRDFVARFLQTAFDGRSEGSIIVNHIYNTRHKRVS
jgi:hypothetical protein